MIVRSFSIGENFAKKYAGLAKYCFYLLLLFLLLLLVHIYSCCVYNIILTISTKHSTRIFPKVPRHISSWRGMVKPGEGDVTCASSEAQVSGASPFLAQSNFVLPSHARTHRHSHICTCLHIQTHTCCAYRVSSGRDMFKQANGD